ncbi:hypothetical protein Vi05172_g2159 [Venturia inaequalis]|nr:hypothetical protein Vi05172_g2159 [Venturia inaequalis]
MSKFISVSLFHLRTIYLFTASDLRTIIFPATFFGLVVALSGSLFTNKPPPISQMAWGLPRLLVWEYVNLLAFNTSSQSQPKAIIEDEINKPFRAIPSGRITASQTINLFYFLQILCFVSAFFWTGGFFPSSILAMLSWLYNFIHLGEKGIITRNFINASGYMCFTAGGAEAILGPENLLNHAFWQWCALFGLVILTTIHAQDFQDQEGDGESGKLTLPLLLGDAIKGKLSIVMPVLAWSILLPWGLEKGFERNGIVHGYLLTTSFSTILCCKAYTAKDHATWRSMYKWYNVWLMAMIALPLAVAHESVNWF